MSNKDPKMSKEELEGFDFMDKSSIESILELTEQYLLPEVSA